MEYYVYITHQCNVRCSYCCSSLVLSGADSSASREHIDRVVEVISANPGEHILMLSGGEPLLKPDLVEYILDRTEGMAGLTRMSLTNGTLLNRVPADLIRRFDALLVSLDGDRNSHERHRGAGTYDVITGNLRNLHPVDDRPTLIARITAEEETDIFRSVTNLLPITDAVYWQIVSKPRFHDPEGFARRYEERLRQLIDYWVDNLREGRLLKIIPFLAVSATMLFGYQKGGKSFRCGAGWALQVIDLDGTIYWCDEYVGNPKGAVGNIKDPTPPDLHYESHEDIFPDCRNCDVSRICLGRCKKCLKEYQHEHVRVYCRLTRTLIEGIRNRLEEIGRAINRLELNLDTFYDVPRCTEEIP